MICTFFNGLEVLYHHAKIGEDRSIRTSCRCENVVFVCFYRQDAAKRQTASIVFTCRPKSAFSPRRVDSLHRFTWNLAHLRDTWVLLVMCNFSPIGSRGWEHGPKKLKISNFWQRVAQQRRTLWLTSTILGAFIRPTTLRKCFKFDMILFRRYGVIAEKLRVSHLARNFPCPL